MVSVPLLKPKTFSNVCRTCLKTEDLFFIDDVQWEDVSLKKVLGNWISFENNYEHKMPQNVCKSCMKWVYNIQYFLIQIQRSQEILQNSLFHDLSPHLTKLQIDINEPIIILEVKDEEKVDHDGLQDGVTAIDSNLSLDNPSTEPSTETNMPSSSLNILPQSSNNYVEIVPPILSHQIPHETQKDKTERYTNEIKKDKAEIQSFRTKVNETQRLFDMHEEWKLREKQGKVVSQLHEDFIYFCGACESGYNTNEELKLHKKISSHYKGGCIYVCPYCKLKTKAHTKLKDHLHMHRNEKLHVCQTCQKGFTTKGDLTRHVRNLHLKQKPKKCKFCYKLFSKPEVLKEHEKIHENFSYICSFCGKSFKVHATWYNHEKSHRKNQLRKDLNKSQVLDNELKYACEICKKTFSSELKVKMHRDFVHSAGKYTCDICGHTVKQKDILQKHIEKVHEGKISTYNCEHCEKVFANRASFRQHLRVHNNDPTYQCKECLKICTTRRNLEIHSRTHTGERSHLCTICGKKFASKFGLKYHMETHTGLPSYHCSFCPQAFYRNYVLQRHLQRKHSQASNSSSQGLSKNTKIYESEGTEESDDEVEVSSRVSFYENMETSDSD